MTRSARELAEAYFEKVRARDIEGMVQLFHDDGEIVTVPVPPAVEESIVIKGHDDIRPFYKKMFVDFERIRPQPGPIIAEGNRAAVEIEVHGLGDGPAVPHVADFFTERDGRIDRLVIYVGASY